MENISKTQLSNIMATGGLVVIIATQLGYTLDEKSVIFVLSALWTLSWNAFNFYQRYSRGDLTAFGARIK